MIDQQQLTSGRRILSAEAVSISEIGVPRNVPLDGMTVALHPGDPRTQAQSLYELSHKDHGALNIWTYLPDGPFDDQTQFTQWMKNQVCSEERVTYSIFDRLSSSYAGMASYLRINPTNACIEIGYIWFAPVLQNTRQATEALFLLMRHVFDDLGYRRLEWKCNALNEKSRNAACRLGFTFEGIFYRNMIVKGHNRDTAWYSIIDSEWPAIHRNFETWLSDDNFDEDGNQKSSLSKLNGEF